MSLPRDEGFEQVTSVCAVATKLQENGIPNSKRRQNTTSIMHHTLQQWHPSEEQAPD